MNFLIVFLGSGIGGALRHGVGVLSLLWFGANFPVGTMIVNIIGSALLGIIAAIFATGEIAHGYEWRLFLATGVMGGFTTFSTFSLDSVALWEKGQHGAAVFYVLASVIVSLAALYGTLWLIRRF